MSSRTGVGSSVSTAASTAITCPPANGFRPVHSRYSTAPRLNRSVRWSTFSPRACSGLMYAGVPTTAPLLVTSPSASTGRASPKSSTFTRPLGASSHKFPGFTSR